MSKKDKTEPELHKDLQPDDPTYEVQTGDEDTPESRPGKHDDDLKSIYSKARSNREHITREDQDENPDAEMISQMVKEAQDEGEFEHTDSDIDLGARKDHVTDEDSEEIPDDEYVESDEDHTVESMEEEAASAEEEEIPEKVAEKPAEIQKDLDYEVENGMVKVKVEGIEYTVPESDIAEAGSKKRYQQNRAANQRFEKAATYAKALQTERQEFEQQQLDSPAKGKLPEQDALSKKAEFVKDLREKMLDAAIDGTEADIDTLIEEAMSKAEVSEKPNSLGEPETHTSDQVVDDYETAYRLDRAEANRMLLDNYPDIMGNDDLRKIAESKYLELQADPDRSFGRTAVEMTREAGNFARRISNSTPEKTAKPSAQSIELEARREKKRVLPQASNARSKTRPPETKKPRSNREYIQAIKRQQGSRY